MNSSISTMTKFNTVSITAADALNTVRELDRAIGMHHRWLKDFHKMMICQDHASLKPDVSDAHLYCEFGKWYAALPASFLAQEESIGKLHSPHKQMHEAANNLLITLKLNPNQRQKSYEDFINSSFDFKLAVRHCQTQLIQRVCTIDHLTGAWNRHTMESRLREEAERVNRGYQTCAICIVDVDYFKRVNDRYGHVAGDKALSTIARFLMENLRVYDITFRYGGEEFLLCLPDVSLSEAKTLLDLIRDNLSCLEIQLDDVNKISLTASFGLTAIDKGESISDAIERADHALLSAKSKGRNRVCVWDSVGENNPALT